MLRHPDKVLELFQAVGYSLFQCQALEETIVHCLLLGPRLSRESDAAIVERLFAQTGELTLGQLVSRLLDLHDFPQDILRDLKAINRERNWLAHRSWKESLPYVNKYPSAKLDDITRRVMTIAEEALRLNERCAVVLEERIVKAGVSKEDLDKITAELYRCWIEP